MILSAKILEFNVRVQLLVPYVHDNQARLKIPDSIVALMDEHWVNWQKGYNRYINLLTQQTSDISIIYDVVFDFLAKLRIRIKGDLQVKINGNDIAFLQINNNTKTVGKIPVTDFAPSLACISQGHLTAKIFAMDPEHPNKKKKPKGAGSIGLKIAYAEQGALPPKLEDYRVMLPEKKSIFDIIYPADKVKYIMYVIAYYISPTGEVSKKESIPVMIVLF